MYSILKFRSEEQRRTYLILQLKLLRVGIWVYKILEIFNVLQEFKEGLL